MSDFRRFAPPIVRDSFSYCGSSLYVTIKDHRHERADPQTLHRLLTYTEPAPRLTKAGKIAKRQPPPHEDPPGHFYCAQLIHYGLKPLKTKDAAKRHLLAAFAAGGTLSVPERILNLEATLRDEYREANEIARKQYEAEKRAREAQERLQLQRRREHEDAIMREVLDAGYLTDGRSSQEVDSGSAENGSSSAQIQDVVASLRPKHLRKILVKLANQLPEVEQAIMKEAGKKRQFSGDGNPKNVGTSKRKSTTSKDKGKGKSKSRKLNEMELMGQFKVVAPYLTEQWPDYTETMTLKVCPSSTGSHLWASFDFGIVSGIIRSTLPPPTTIGAPCPFLWRGRENEMSFGPSNTGQITFLGDGKIKGRMDWMGDFDFVGVEVERQNVVWPKSVKGWKAEWRSLNDISYEEERVARWGRGWVTDHVEKPSVSDTTSAEESEGQESDNCAY